MTAVHSQSLPRTAVRSVLFVPAPRLDLAAKAAHSGAGVVILDLEDAVGKQQKAESRDGLAEAAALLGDCAVWVRVNGPQTVWFDADLAAVPAQVQAVVIPKFEGPLDVGRPYVAGIETATGLDADLAGAAACYFGAEDLIADLGGIRTISNHEVAVPRAMCALAARRAGIAAIDMVTVDVNDVERFGQEAREARALGYAGKLCINPRQVRSANAVWAGTVEELDRARRLVAAFRAHGDGVLRFEGQMVDEPVVAQAEALLKP